MKIRGLFLTLSLSSVSALVGAAPIAFEDKSSLLAISGTAAETWGLTWTDLNGDGWPDLFLQGHRDYPRIFRNTGNGVFEDVANEWDPNQLWMDKTWDDKHGVSSGDFDNDGDQDYLMSVSASGSAQLLQNLSESGGKFVDVASDLGVAWDDNARLGEWVDFNNDGLLDLVQHTRNGSIVREQKAGGGFRNLVTDVCPGQGDYGQLIDVNNDGSLDFVCGRQGTFPQEVYDLSGGGFSNSATLSNLIPNVGNVLNSFAGDFNNDLKTDIILMRGSLRPPSAAKIDSHSIDGWLAGGSEDVGFEFVANGAFDVILDHHPMGIYANAKTATLSANGTTSAYLGGAQITYSASTGKWTVKKGGSLGLYIQIRAVNPIGAPTLINIDNGDMPASLFHLENSNSGFSAQYRTGISNLESCVSGVAADFDNDMDLDIYLACQHGVNNLANVYMDNQGDGTFQRVWSHGGEGPTGAGLEYGVADSVAYADYDVDGFIDVAVTNGMLYYPFSEGGPFTLLRNKGNSNNWVQLDLQGVTSNRDGIGAKIYATAGGVTQLREADGGYHRWSQNTKRIHFGLASNARVNITVEWPSGEVDTFTNVQANSVYKAVEGTSSLSKVTLGPVVRTQVASGDECGEPPYEKTYGPGITMWRNCGSNGDWQIRFNSGLYDDHPLLSAGTIEGNSAFSYASGLNLNSGDVLSLAGRLLSFDVGVQNKVVAKKGINFNTGVQISSCMEFTDQDIPRVILGSSQKRITPPFDLVTLQSCGSSTPTPTPPTPTPPVDDSAACNQPAYNNKTEKGVFVWSDCDGSGLWHMRVTGGGDAGGTVYQGVLESSGGVNYTGYSIENNDVLDTSVANQLAYQLKVWNNAQDGINFTPAANACLTTTDGLPVYVGESRLELGSSINLTTLESCGGTTPVDTTAACGEPSYNNRTQPGFYVWKNCDSTASAESWYMRAVGGGLAWGPYAGSISASAAISASGSSLEGNDVLTSGTTVNFRLNVGGGGVDGANLSVPASSNACLNVTSLPSGSQVYIGEGKQAMSNSFSLATLGSCP
ncbi:CRTAC1 family protein [Halioxenophilus aromaticivorans]|uniref:ASPIC/UnbV domain-containing protein n=1 Tax=Halioxenophilus aromaticivorans TaxID=1306992 RepID=A0AAV3U1N5_9ALTE